MPHSKLSSVRHRYQNACGYCGVTETTVGSELTIDHYRPQSAGGGDDENNLIYACMKCNQYKGDFWPDDEDLTLEQRVLHPQLDDLAAHVRENEQTGQIDAISETGKFYIALLRLNRPQLIEHRLVRSIRTIVSEKQRLLEQQNVELQKTIEVQERYIAILEAQLEELS
jgi:hypothetical protein